MNAVRRVRFRAIHLAALVFALLAAGAFAAQPIRLHPENPRWFEWRGKTVALITSAEHHGAVLNRDFDFRRYLETLERDGLNYTRMFAGSYVEPPGAFGIGRNTLAPAPGRFLAPSARSEQPGYAGGGNKLDLDRFSPEYLARLKEFLTEAGRRGVVVELTLFCSTYSDAQWAIDVDFNEFDFRRAQVGFGPRQFYENFRVAIIAHILDIDLNVAG
ncbi:MAG TPA: hypothetical protein PLX89_02980 [Verrucomicrobiota bacterium]|nr:hypothetical protein [Verrucomicrobiota bacterium]